jgi:hypothetical protein
MAETEHALTECTIVGPPSYEFARLMSFSIVRLLIGFVRWGFLTQCTKGRFSAASGLTTCYNWSESFGGCLHHYSTLKWLRCGFVQPCWLHLERGRPVLVPGCAPKPFCSFLTTPSSGFCSSASLLYALCWVVGNCAQSAVRIWWLAPTPRCARHALPTPSSSATAATCDTLTDPVSPVHLVAALSLFQCKAGLAARYTADRQTFECEACPAGAQWYTVTEFCHLR